MGKRRISQMTSKTLAASTDLVILSQSKTRVGVVIGPASTAIGGGAAVNFAFGVKASGTVGLSFNAASAWLALDIDVHGDIVRQDLHAFAVGATPTVNVIEVYEEDD